MDFLTNMWIGILLSAAAVFFWSFLSNAVLPVHRGDFQPLPDEKRFGDAVKSMSIPPGYYSFPHMKHSDCKTPEGKAKWMAGPMGMINVWTPKMSMGRNMFLSYVVYLCVAVLMAYVADLALPHGGSFAQKWQVTGTLGVMAYCFAFLPRMIWFQVPGRVMFSNLFDGVVQGLLSGAVFAAVWPTTTIAGTLHV